MDDELIYNTFPMKLSKLSLSRLNYITLMGVIHEGNGGYKLFVFPMDDTFIVECVVDGINKGADEETTMDVGGMGRGISPS